jgi:class 3 adenylate cyclase
MRGMASLPAGTVTFVFSDVEGSTGLLKRLGDGYGEQLERSPGDIRKGRR